MLARNPISAVLIALAALDWYSILVFFNTRKIP